MLDFAKLLTEYGPVGTLLLSWFLFGIYYRSKEKQLLDSTNSRLEDKDKQIDKFVGTINELTDALKNTRRGE